MIRIFYGDNRVMAQKVIVQQLGKDYEVIEADKLQRDDMPSVFLGTSLFGETRSILIKDLSENKDCWEILPNFIEGCPHHIVIWETKLDKRSAVYKSLSKNKYIELKEFAMAEDPNKFISFRIFDAAVAGNAKGALKMCEEIDISDDAAYLLIGSLTSQAIKKMQAGNSRMPRVIKILAQADLDMKSAAVEPWAIVKAALLKIAN
jgi:DNA polymerase III delta subunit